MAAAQRLSEDQFGKVVDLTPLVSIDFVIRNHEGAFLAGVRSNEPARGFWFVPGGRILKDEPVADAIERLLRNEVGGLPGSREFFGVYEHFYPSNALGIPGVTTHYVVLGFLVLADAGWFPRGDTQHERFAWLDPARAVDEELVHENTKVYARRLLGLPGGGLDGGFRPRDRAS